MSALPESRRRAAPQGDPLDTGFFARSVHVVARELVGCTLLHDGVGGTIVETESYHAEDPACHAYNGPTARSSILWGPPGTAYVYLSYGIHSLLNAVAEPEGSAAAVLIRALEPTAGVAAMRTRRHGRPVEELCSGPGKLAQALGIGLELNGASLLEPPFAVLASEAAWRGPEIHAGPRIGITRAADLPWRFCAAGSRFVSRPATPRPSRKPRDRSPRE